MTLPLNTISMSQVNIELAREINAAISMSDLEIRTLSGTAFGTVGMGNLKGKTAIFEFTISSNQTNANLRTLAIAAGWNGVFPVYATINSGVSINGSVSGNSTAALTIDGSWPRGVTLINNGSILGRGGNGGSAGASGATGGRALLVSVAASINNIGTIAGGGGGGGGGSGASSLGTRNCSMGEDSCSSSAGGGGGGGGQSSIGFNSSGGAGGAWSGSGSTGCTGTNGVTGGAGSSLGPGSGGAGASVGICTCPACSVTGGRGGNGGSYGSAGSPAGGANGAAGEAVNGNSNITWLAFGTRLGPII